MHSIPAGTYVSIPYWLWILTITLHYALHTIANPALHQIRTEKKQVYHRHKLRYFSLFFAA